MLPIEEPLVIVPVETKKDVFVFKLLRKGSRLGTPFVFGFPSSNRLAGRLHFRLAIRKKQW